MDTVFRVRLRSYGFLHPGRERLRTVIKKSWALVPGSTLYGAVAAALIRLDGVDRASPGEGTGGYHHLLRLVSAGGRRSGIRFTPLLPVGADTALGSAQDYCARAQALRTSSGEAFFQTTPHAPLDRATWRIHDDLYAFSSHRGHQDYEGFVFAPRDWGGDLRRALRMLPFLPVGGKGKYSLVEGRVADEIELHRFRAELEAFLPSMAAVRLLTPMIMQDAQSSWLFRHATAVTNLPRLRRYRVWRTGAYYDFVDGAFESFGFDPEHGDEEEDGLSGGAESQGVTGIPEDSCFALDAEPETIRQVAERFIHGAGNPSWTYLGWGQVVIE